MDEKKTLGLTAFVTVLDIISDIMGMFRSAFHPLLASALENLHALVVSIPIIVLKNSFLTRSTKFGLAIFLCLSIFMAICAIIRIAGFHYKGVEDDTWEFFWQQLEGAVAVMMASITAFRTLFVKQTTNADDTTSRSPVESLLHRFYMRFQSLARARPDEKVVSTDSRPILRLPKLPSPVFTGVRTFVRKNNRTDVSDATFASQDSVYDGSDGDYHAILRVHTQGTGRNTSSHGQP